LAERVWTVVATIEQPELSPHSPPPHRQIAEKNIFAGIALAFFKPAAFIIANLNRFGPI